MQGCGPRGSLGVTSHTPGSVRKCEGVNPHTPKATPTLRDGLQKKSRIDPIYLDADNVRHTVEKLLMRATTLLQTTPRSEVCLQSYGAPKLRESRLARFRDSHSKVPGEKSHLDVGPVERCKVYYKGEGGGFPQVQAVVSLMCVCCPWFVQAPRVFQLCTNHLVWVVCKPV